VDDHDLAENLMPPVWLGPWHLPACGALCHLHEFPVTRAPSGAESRSPSSSACMHRHPALTAHVHGYKLGWCQVLMPATFKGVQAASAWLRAAPCCPVSATCHTLGLFITIKSCFSTVCLPHETMSAT